MSDGPKIMTAMEPADVSQMAMIECVRQVADNGKTTNRLLEQMQVELRDVRERVIRIEAGQLEVEVDEVKQHMTSFRGRLEALEAKENQRAGARAAADALLKYGPFVIALMTALFILLVATGRIVL